MLSRGNAPAGLGYALVPVLDFVNHADDRDGAQRLGFRVDESDIYLIANRDFRRGAEAASSYVGGVGPLPADYALHAFGFVPDGYRSCAVRVGDDEVALTTTGDAAWDAAALHAARAAAPDGALAAARGAPGRSTPAPRHVRPRPRSPTRCARTWRGRPLLGSARRSLISLGRSVNNFLLTKLTSMAHCPW